MEKILIIVPAYNEADSIRKVVEDLHSANDNWDILVVNDASTDHTSSIAKEAGYATIIDLPYNLGIGGGVQSGFKYAVRNNYDYALQFDGDGQHSAKEIEKLLDIVTRGKADVAIGSRFNQKHSGFKSSFFRRIGIKVFQLFSYMFIQQKITDHTSGFRAYNKKSLRFLAEQYPSEK